MSEPTNIQKAISIVRTGLSSSAASAEELQKILETAIETLKSESPSVRYGCHCDLEWDPMPGMEPDGCVLDENRPHHCIYAAGLVDKWECQYWRPVLKN